VFAPDPYSAIKLSLWVGFWCVLVSVPIALPLGWLLARRQFPGKSLLSTLILSPLVIPPVVTGLLLLRLLGRTNSLGAFVHEHLGIEVAFSLSGAVIAAFVVGLPLFVIAAREAFASVDPSFEQVARSLGDTPWTAFRRTTLPLALPGIAAGALLSFARALGEFGATAVLSGNIEGKTRTIALAIYTLLDSPSGERETSILLWASIAISFVALAGFEALSRWQRRRLEL
jgi:molybdate transport system permease protein